MIHHGHRAPGRLGIVGASTLLFVVLLSIPSGLFVLTYGAMEIWRLSYPGQAIELWTDGRGVSFGAFPVGLTIEPYSFVARWNRFVTILTTVVGIFYLPNRKVSKFARLGVSWAVFTIFAADVVFRVWYRHWV